MRIVDVRDTVVPIKSAIRNAYIDFSQMTVSVVAVVTDVIRDGRPVVGYGFNSNGRYAPQGLLRERFIPRLKAAETETLLDEGGENLDPHKVWATLMTNEKPGGHGERSVAVGVLAGVTDVIRDGRPVVGYGFNSNGRYAQQGLLRERFMPRLKAAETETLLDEGGENLDPHKVWATLMTNEKPGGHGERSVAVGVLDMAVWDAAAKIAGVPLYRLLADRYRGGEADDRVFVYAAGGYYYPGKDQEGLRNEFRRYLDFGYTV